MSQNRIAKMHNFYTFNMTDAIPNSLIQLYTQVQYVTKYSDTFAHYVVHCDPVEGH